MLAWVGSLEEIPTGRGFLGHSLEHLDTGPSIRIGRLISHVKDAVLKVPACCGRLSVHRSLAGHVSLRPLRGLLQLIVHEAACWANPGRFLQADQLIISLHRFKIPIILRFQDLYCGI